LFQKFNSQTFFICLKDFTLSQFLFTPIQLKEIELLRLPVTENVLENGCFLIEDKSYDNWPLICDSSRRSIDWLRTYHKEKQLFVIRQHVILIKKSCLDLSNFLKEYFCCYLNRK
jgi:hypothetical protein